MIRMVYSTEEKKEGEEERKTKKKLLTSNSYERRKAKETEGNMQPHLVKNEDHIRLMASSLKATSVSRPGMISFPDPTWRKHRTI